MKTQDENPSEGASNDVPEESDFMEADVADSKKDELDGLSFDMDEDQTAESEQEQEIEFEGAPPKKF